MNYEDKFRTVEASLRPRNKFKHEEAVDLLVTVVRDADDHISELEMKLLYHSIMLGMSVLGFIFIGLKIVL